VSTLFRVTLLGTGVPIPRADRFGPSTLIEAGEQTVLIDAGRGAVEPNHRAYTNMAGFLSFVVFKV